MATATATKTCTRCGQELAATADFFYRRSKSGDGLQPHCKKCDNKRSNERYHSTYKLDGRHKKWSENSWYERNYGISAVQYWEMHEAQGGACFTCRSDNGGKRLFVDHNHATGAVRKLLCHGCNSAIGFVAENCNTLIALVEYLALHEED